MPIWSLEFYAIPKGYWDETRRVPSSWRDVVAGGPLHVVRGSSSLVFNWGFASPHRKVPTDFFAIVARTAIELEPGDYQFTTYSDDGVRIYIDDRKKPILESWRSGPDQRRYKVVPLSGRVRLRIEYFEATERAHLEVRIRKVS